MARKFHWRHPLRRRRIAPWQAASPKRGAGEFATTEFAADYGFDPLGSYSGVSDDDDGAPEQDADDL